MSARSKKASRGKQRGPAAPSAVQYNSELDSLHTHCQMMISAPAELGARLMDRELMANVADIPALTVDADNLTKELKSSMDKLETIRNQDLKLRRTTNPMANPMPYFGLASDYESWCQNFTTNVMPHAEKVVSAIAVAEIKLKEKQNAAK